MTTLTLERYAEMRAEMDAGSLRDDVLADSGTTLDAWTAVQRKWLESMSAELERGRFELTNRYTRAFLARQSALQKSSAPVPAGASEAVLSSADAPLADRSPDEGRETTPMPMPRSIVDREPFAPVPPALATAIATPHYASALSPRSDEDTAPATRSPPRMPLPFQPGAAGAPLPISAAIHAPIEADPAERTMLALPTPDRPALPFDPRGAAARTPALPTPPRPAFPAPPRPGLPVSPLPGRPVPPNDADVTIFALPPPAPEQLPFRPAVPNASPPIPPSKDRIVPDPDGGATLLTLSQPLAPSLPFRPTAAAPQDASDADDERTLQLSGIHRQALFPRPGGAPAAQSAAPPGPPRAVVSESLTLEQHASLHAELDHAPSRATDTLRRYRITREELVAVDARWKQRFADPAVLARWQEVYRIYRGLIAPRT